MNKIYKSVWCEATGTWVATSETARSKTKRGGAGRGRKIGGSAGGIGRGNADGRSVDGFGSWQRSHKLFRCQWSGPYCRPQCVGCWQRGGCRRRKCAGNFHRLHRHW
ncbi:ESPR domain-containing protein [Paraburkholderia sp. BL23I1N1]|uniref:ESPR domain-containing protein n=1 Tax=Paraburkholderia sp. BL23I1N1 TaxID=1938802 RepID=UPI000E73E212|nr:ESPR domain-containing protein [Paraburkholderia sp. BL23I1N1]